jgi:hypothetical protein
MVIIPFSFAILANVYPVATLKVTQDIFYVLFGADFELANLINQGILLPID